MEIEPHHYVYVVQLNLTILDSRKPSYSPPREINPSKIVYVGITGRTPEERFEQHKKGYKASRAVKYYGIKLLPNLYDEFNPMSYDAAKDKEKKYAEELAIERGYVVYGGH